MFEFPILQLPPYMGVAYMHTPYIEITLHGVLIAENYSRLSTADLWIEFPLLHL